MVITLIRTLILYGAVIFAVRLMGKRQLSQLQTSELVVTMLISDLAVIPMQDNGQPLFSGLLPILILIVLEIFFSFLMMKNRSVRRMLSGNPVIVIRNGHLLQKNMKALRMSIDDLMEQLHQKDIFALCEVAYAIVETNGTMSVLKYASADTVRLSDLHLTAEDPGPDTAVILDGKICTEALSAAGKNENWLQKILKQEKTSVREVFLMTANQGGQYTLIRKE